MTDVQPHLARLAATPADTAALRAIEAVYGPAGRWEELLRIYEDSARRADKKATASLLHKAALICLNELQSAPRAESYLRLALEAVPQDLASLQTLRQIYLKRGDHERAADTYEKELARTNDPKAKVLGLVTLAELYRTHLGRLEKALASLKAAQRLDAANPRVLQALAAIYVQQGHRELAQAALLDELTAAGPQDELLARMLALAQQLLKHPRLHPLAVQLLARMLQGKPDLAAAQGLQRELQTYASSWQRKVTELEATAVRLASGSEAAETWMSVAEVQLVYGKAVEPCIASLDRALMAAPAHPGALRLLEDVYGEAGRWGELAMKLEMMAAYTRESEAAIELYLKAALINSVRLDNIDASVRIYQRVLLLDPGNKVASNALAEYFRERKDWPSALAVLNAWATHAPQAADQVAAHYACSRILEETGDKIAAQPHYEAMLALEPENSAAALALEDVYRQKHDHPALARALHGKLTGLAGPARLPVLRELGELCAGPLDEPATALQALGELYSLSPSVVLLQQVQALATRAKHFETLPSIIEASLDKLPIPQEQVDVMHTLATLYEGTRDAPIEALRIYRRILTLAPADDRARQRAEHLIGVAGQSTDKVAFFREQADLAPSPTEKVGFLKRLASELLTGAKDYVQCIDVYREILRLAPGDSEALDGSLALYRREDRWADVALGLAEKAARQPLAAQRLPLMLEHAAILEQQLADVDSAVDVYTAVLGLVPGDLSALTALEHLLPRARAVADIAGLLLPHYVRAAAWAKAAQMYEIRLHAETDPAERATLLRALALLQKDKLGQPAEAFATLLRAFQADPAPGDLMTQLETLGRQVNDVKAVVRALRAAFLVLDGDARATVTQHAAILAQELGDFSGATLDYVRALGVGTPPVTALGGLKALRARGADLSTLTQIVRQVTENFEEPQRTSVWRHVARFCEQDMKSPEESIAAWKAVLVEKPGDPEATAELDKLYMASANPDERVNHLRAKVENATDDTSRAADGLQLADALANQMSDVPGAIEMLRKIVDASPGERPVWRQLADLYGRVGDLTQSSQAMQREIGLMSDGDERRARLVVYATLCGKELGDLTGAVNALKSILTSDAKNAAAIGLLEELRGLGGDPSTHAELLTLLQSCYRAAGRWQDVVALLTQALETAGDVEVRVTMLKEIGSIKATKLNDAAGAFNDLLRAFNEKPQDTTLRLDLESIAESSGRFSDLAEAYSAALSFLGDSDASRAIRRKLAETLDKRLNRGAEAVEHYKALSGGRLPDDLGSLESMERLLRGQSRPAELADVLTALLARLPADAVERRKTLLLELGQICDEALSDKARAIENYQTLVALDAKHVEALRRLSRLLGDMGQLDLLAPVLDKLVELGPLNVSLVDDLVRRAQVMLQLNNPEEAFKSYRNALLKKREHPPALEGLEAMIDQLPNKLELAQILEPIYTSKQDHAKLAWILEKKLDSTTEAVARKGLLRRIGDIYENRLQQKDRAFTMARRSLTEDPADMGVRMWIEKLAGETGALRELADAYVEEGSKAAAPLNLQFFRRAAALFHEKLNDLPSAVVQYQAILQIEARDEKALTGLDTIFRANGDHTELVNVLQRRLAQTAGLERKRDLLNEIAKLQSEQLHDLGAAVATYRELLLLTPDDPAPFAQIERLLGEMSAWDDLSTIYQAEVTRLSEKRGREVVLRRLELAYRRGRIFDEQFMDRDHARQIFDTILTEEPTHPSTITYLETRAQAGIFEAITLLEKVYLTGKAWQKYVQLLDLKLAQTAETELRCAIYLQISQVYDIEMKQGDMAFISVTRAYNENRADNALLERLEAVAAKYAMLDELVDVLANDLDALPDPRLRQHLLHRLGHVCGNQLDRAEEAIAHLQSALQYEPSDEVALGALDALLEKNGMWAALADILERRIEVANEPGTKSQLLERLAGVWGDKLMDAEAALRCHKQILDIDPDHPITLKSMQKLYAEVGNLDALANNLIRQAAVLKDPDEQVRIHSAAGTLYAEELNDNNQAIAHWQMVIDVDPTHDEANQSLLVLLTAEERWEELAALYRKQLAHTQDPANKLDINRRLGVILGEKLGRTEDALSSWLKVIEQDPKNADALRALLPLYTERAMWQEFVTMARRLIPLVQPAEAKDVRFLLAKALGENLGNRDDAIKLAREVRATEPHTVEQLTRLGEMLCNIQAWDEAVIAIEKAAALDPDPAAKVRRYYEAASVFRDKLNKPNDARNAYESILAVTPADGEAYTALAQIYRNTTDWRKLVALNEDFVPHAPPDVRLQILIEIRDVQDQRLAAKDLAFIAGCRVYKENPHDLAMAEVLERIALESAAAEELVAVLEDEIENVVDPSIKVASFRRIARLYADHVKDVNSAEMTLNRILDVQPGDVESLDTLAALGAREERYDKQIAALERKLESTADAQGKKSLLSEISRIWEDKIGEVDEAVSSLQRILKIDGADAGALDELGRVYAAHTRWAELAQTLTRKVELAQDPAENVALRMRVAGLCEAELNDMDAAIQWYRGVLDFEPGHTAALSSLERLYTGFERWSELIQIFETQVGLAHDTEEKIRLLTKMASIYENNFDSLKDAAACFERMFEIDNRHVASIKSLERLLRAMGEWNRLIEVLQHHVTLLADSNAITDLHLEIGEIYYKELSRVDKAEQVYNKAREVNPKSTAALHALGRLYERSGNWFQSLEMLQREADALGKDVAALPALIRIGKINEDMLSDLAAAKTAYQRALTIESSYGPALASLKEIARSTEDWDHYAEYLITEAETVDDPEQKTELFVEAAKFFQQIREDETSAIRFYQRALAITPEHYEASRCLADICFRNEMWEEARDLYMVVVELLDAGQDPKDFCQKNYRLGYINEKMGSGDTALGYYKKAFDADATYLPALEGLGQALLGAEQWDEAQKVFQTVLIHHRDSLTESEIVDIQWQLGDICLKQGQADRAYKQFEKAVEIDSDHAQTLLALARLDQQIGNWELAYNRLSRYAEVAPGPERVPVLTEMSEIARERLKDLARSIDPLERARRLGSPPLDVLQRLGNAYLQAQQASKAVEVLEQAVAVATDASVKSDLCYLLGTVYEQQIKHEPMAVQKYNDALDAMATNIKAFECIERILGQRQEWALLESNYRAMVARAKDLSPGIRVILWRSLGDLYRQVLHNIDNAIMAYEVIQKLDPGKPQDIAVLAELYAHKPDNRARAIDMQHDMLVNADNPVTPIRTLRKLYHAGRDFDAVYVLCTALVFLKEADDEEKKLFEYLARGVPPRASRGLSEDQWQLLLDPVMAGPIGVLISTLYRAAPEFVTVPAKDLGLKKKDQLDVRQSELYFASMVRYVAGVLTLPLVDVYRKSGSMEPLYLAHAQPPALVAGESNEIFRDAAQRLVLYHIGRNMAYARPELFLPRVHPGAELRDLLIGLCLVYNRTLQHNGDPREVDRWATAFEKLPAGALKRLQGPARDAFPEIIKGKPLAVYAAAVEKVAARVGLVACADMGAAARGVTEGGEGASPVPVRDRIRELVMFSVSKQYLQVRKIMGAALVEGKAAG